MILNKRNLADIKSSGTIQVPEASTFNLKEKVLQFGTGVLLRGLPEYFIDKANKTGVFNGRVVVVKSTGKGTTNDFDKQDSIYTIGIRGIENNQKIEENVICGALSRVLSAQTQWNSILEVARSKDLVLVTSNTTEVGIKLTEDSIFSSPPDSFPGKLLAVLYERFSFFEGDEDKGLVIVPTELISDNGAVLKDIVLSLAKQNNLGKSFIFWLEQSNTFCNSLVDRIVPGRPDDNTLISLENELGYNDELLIIAEVYRLWAIEGDEKVRRVLSFEQADPGVIITPDISKFKELKLRLLNGSHTLTCGVAVLAGFDTVYAAMKDADFSEFITTLLQDELCHAIPHPVSPEEAWRFAVNVLDRFRNPFIKHYWQSISANYAMKLKMRVVPMLKRHYKNHNNVPEHMAFGFAAHLLFMRSVEEDGLFHGSFQGKTYKVEEEQARYYSELWAHSASLREVVDKALAKTELWDADLSILPGFSESVKEHLQIIEDLGVIDAIRKINCKKILQ